MSMNEPYSVSTDGVVGQVFNLAAWTSQESGGRGVADSSSGRRADAREMVRVFNALTARVQAIQQRRVDSRRNYERECGYPELGVEIDVQTYAEQFRRNSVAARVVEIFPLETWRVTPELYEDENPKNVTQFEAQWDSLGRQMGRGVFAAGAGSELKSDSVLWDYCRRADVVSGIGRFGVMVLGISDGGKLDQPVDGVEEFYRSEGESEVEVAVVKPTSRGGRGAGAGVRKSFVRASGGESRQSPRNKLREIRVFAEDNVTVVETEQDERSPRFQQPTMYEVTFGDGGGVSTGTFGVAKTVTKKVHWTRVIHIADNLLDSEVYGVPRMRPVFDHLLGLRKLYCSSPEMYWAAAFPGLAASTHPSLGGDVDFDETALKKAFENYLNTLQRFLLLDGMSVNQLAPQVVDPSPMIERQIEAVCIKIECPVRIFKGSEMGQLASTQDDANWEDRRRSRRINHATPNIIFKLADRLIAAGVLSAPESYTAWWPESRNQPPKEKAAYTFQMTQALAQYVTSKAYLVMGRLDYLTKVVGYPEAEAQAVIDNTPDFESKMSEMMDADARAKAAKLTNVPPGNPNDPKDNGVSTRTLNPSEGGGSSRDNRTK